MTTQSMNNVVLPLELVLRVVECLAPLTTIAFSPNSPSAKTIRSFTLVSRLTYPIALRLLYTHCLYIDSSERLGLLLLSLARYNPFNSLTTNIVDDDDTNIEPPPPCTLPPVNILPCLQNLYLSPFPAKSIDDLPVAHWIFELFSITRNTLRRLVTRIPLETLTTEQDHLNVYPRLHDAFKSLTALEEFVAVDDDLCLHTANHMPVWAHWTNLRRLSLYNVHLGHHELGYLARLPVLEQVLIHAPAFDASKSRWDSLFTQVTAPVSMTRTSTTNLTNNPTPTTPPQLRHGIEIIYLHIDFHFGQDLKDVTRQLLERIYWARIYNTEHHHQEEASSQRRRRVTVTAIAAREVWAPPSEWTDIRMNWARAATVEGGLWDLERNPRFRRSEVDPDLWLHRSVYGDEEERVEVYDVSRDYLWSSFAW